MHQPTATTAFLLLHKQSLDSINPPHQGQNRDAEPVSTKTDLHPLLQVCLSSTAASDRHRAQPCIRCHQQDLQNIFTREDRQVSLKASQQGSPPQARKRWTPGFQGQPSSGHHQAQALHPQEPLLQGSHSSPEPTTTFTPRETHSQEQDTSPPAKKTSYLQLHPPTELGRTNHGCQRANPSPTATHHGSEPPGLPTTNTTTSLKTHCLPPSWPFYSR